MEKLQLSRSDLANKSGVHLSEISRILNGKQSLSIKNLDLLTEALALPQGSLYGDYIQECFNESGTLNRRKSKQFILRCASMDNALIDDLLDLVLEEMSKTIRNQNCIVIFHAAEHLLEGELEEKALELYGFVTENMPDHFSKEVAISYYRRFYILRLTDQGKQAQAQMLEHLNFMPEKYQALSFVWITATSYVQRKWDETLHYAIKLEKLAKTKDHYGIALLYQSLALNCLGSPLEDILKLIDRYEKVNDYYAEVAVGNRYCAYLDFGEFQYVDDYLEWLEARDDVRFGLPRVLEAYVGLKRYKDIEQILKKYEKEIQEWESYKDPYDVQMYLRFRYAYSMYLFEIDRYSEGLDEVLDIAKRSKEMGNSERFNQALLIYWQYRDYV